MLLPENHEKLKYCVIELVKGRGTTKDIEKGLFKGLVKESGLDFLWMKTTSSIIRGCNLEYYNILSVEIYDGIIKSLTFFKAEKDEQKKAENLIREIFECFDDIRLEKDNRLIDIDKYSDIPADFNRVQSVIKTTPTKTIHSSIIQDFHKHGNDTAKTNTNVNHNVYNSNIHYAKSEPEACFFKRKGRKPTKKILEELDKKLDLIMGGEYNPELPKTKDDDSKGVDKSRCTNDFNGLYDGYY